MGISPILNVFSLYERVITMTTQVKLNGLETTFAQLVKVWKGTDHPTTDKILNGLGIETAGLEQSKLQALRSAVRTYGDKLKGLGVILPVLDKLPKGKAKFSLSADEIAMLNGIGEEGEEGEEKAEVVDPVTETTTPTTQSKNKRAK
jgi:hypothetical protein